MTEIVCNDVMKWAAWYSGAKFHALLCDPPYHLTSITKRFGQPWSAPVKVDEFFDGNGNSKGASPYSRTSTGFMGQQWDGGDIAFRPEMWAALADHLLPGAFGMAFASSRGWHRLACAIEDAGLIIHPSIFGWAYGSGFPKATRIDTQIDKAAGAERETIGERVRLGDKKTYPNNNDMAIFNPGENNNITQPSTPLARAWEGHRYGLQALKPALEPIIVFQKPYEGKPIDCITETGAGALWIEGGRIPTEDKLDGGGYITTCAEGWDRPYRHDESRKDYYLEKKNEMVKHAQESGRWPANFILDDEAAKRLDEMSGESTSRTTGYNWNTSSNDNPVHITKNIKSGMHFSDTGGASRFFFRYQADALDEADSVFYCAKASRSERDKGLEEMPLIEMPHSNFDKCENCGGYLGVLIGGKDAKGACRCNDPKRVGNKLHNPHPTVKPIKLTEYLARLLLPPAEYSPRRILIPFAGSGSEMIGAGLAGWEEITGIEMSDEYCKIAEARINQWLNQPRQMELIDGR